MNTEDLRQSELMSHLLDALDQGTSIGAQGRLVFTMVSRFFLSEDELVEWLVKDPEVDQTKAEALYHQVESNDYSPPSRETIIEYDSQQDFELCPRPDDPDCCNVYQHLDFPPDVYEHITDYHAGKAAN
jgi:hypothetical protein